SGCWPTSSATASPASRCTGSRSAPRCCCGCRRATERPLRPSRAGLAAPGQDVDPRRPASSWPRVARPPRGPAARPAATATPSTGRPVRPAKEPRCPRSTASTGSSSTCATWTARAFYEAVFAVTLQPLKPPGDDGLEMWECPGGPDRYGANGARCRMPGGEPGPGGTVVYFATEHCGDAAERVVAAGGRIMRPRMSIGPFGFIALVFDTEGNLIGLHSMQ